MGKAAALLVRLYQKTIGRILPQRCRFAPSCSEYAVDALCTNGLVRGLLQTGWRLLRCGPWTSGGWDPVKEMKAGPVRRAMRAVTHG